MSLGVNIKGIQNSLQGITEVLNVGLLTLQGEMCSSSSQENLS